MNVKRRLVRDSLIAAVIASVILGAAMALLVDQLTRQRAQNSLRRQAETLAESLDPLILSGEIDLAGVRRYVPPTDYIEVRFNDGTVIRSDPQDNVDRYSVTVPASDDVLLTLSAPKSELSSRTWAIATFAAVSLASLVGAMLLAAVQAKRLAAPFENLTKSADRLAMGDFSVRSPRSDIEEFDQLGNALDDGARRISELVTVERAFTSRARHQLRTPLTAMMLRLEELADFNDPDVRIEAEAALGQARRLSSTIDELVQLSRTGKAGRGIDIDLRQLVSLHVQDWQARFASTKRGLRLVDGPDVRAYVTPGVIGQLVDVVLDNALRHGQGTVTVRVEQSDNNSDASDNSDRKSDDRSEHASQRKSANATDESRIAPGMKKGGLAMTTIQISDEGPGMEEERLSTVLTGTPGPGAVHGIGLPLMHELIEAEGGSLTIVRNSPFTILCSIPLHKWDQN